MSESIFKDLRFRDPQNVFENAIKKGMKRPYEYMYMNSSIMFDYFKHKETKVYKSYFNISMRLMTHKEYCELMSCREK